MKRADRQLQPIRPPAGSTRDGYRVTVKQYPVNDTQVRNSTDLEAISAARPEVGRVIRGMLSVALELAFMLPRPMLERFVECVIERLDDLDGDPDLEPIDEREPD